MKSSTNIPAMLTNDLRILHRTLLYIGLWLSLMYYTPLSAQINELYLTANTNGLAFVGTAAVKTTDLLKTADGFVSAARGFYGRQYAIGGGMGFEYMRTYGHSNLGSVGLGYEFLRSKATINRSIVFTDLLLSDTSDASGKVFFQTHTITFRPMLGHRWAHGKSQYDLIGGFDISALFAPTQNVSASTPSSTIAYRKKVTTIDVDAHAVIRMAMRNGAWGVFADYSHGLRNYSQKFIIGNVLEARSRTLRLGLSYRFYKKDLGKVEIQGAEELEIRKIKVQRRKKR